MPLIGAQGPGSNISWRGNLDEYPDFFEFPQILDSEIGIAVTSQSQTITGINYKALVTAVGSGASVSVNGGSYVNGNDPNNPIIIRNSDVISLQIRTIDTNTRFDFNKNYNVDVTVGKRSASWLVRSKLLDDTPEAFTFTPSINNEVSIARTSNEVVVQGIDGDIGVDVLVTSTTGILFINGVNSGRAAKIVNNDRLYLQNTTSGFYDTNIDTTIVLGTYTTTWPIKTRVADKTVNSFVLGSVTNVGINTILISNTITLSGADPNVNGNNPLEASILGANGEFRVVRGGVEVRGYSPSPFTVQNGDQITVKAVASQNFATTIGATLTVSGVSDTYSITTRPTPIKTFPSQFTFVDKTGVERTNTLNPPENRIDSDPITLVGMSTAAADFGTATITGNGGDGNPAQFRVVRNGVTVRDFASTSFQVRNGDQITLRITSSPNPLGSVQAVFTINGINTTDVLAGVAGSTSDTWVVTSAQRFCNITAFTLPQETNANPNQTYSRTFVASGFDKDCNCTITTSDTTNSFLKVGNVTGTSLSVKVGDTVEVFLTCPYFDSTRSTTVTITSSFGTTRSATFTVIPKAPPLPVVTLDANPRNSPFVFPVGGSTILTYTYDFVTNPAVVTNFGVTTVTTPKSTGTNATITNILTTTTYSITVSNSTGSATATVQVTVGTPPAPTISLCTSDTAVCANTTNRPFGSSVTLFWKSGFSTSVTSPDFNTGNLQNGSITIPTLTQDNKIYSITATGPGGTVTATQKINLSPTVTLTVNPNTIINGSLTGSTLVWNSNLATRVVSSNGFTAFSLGGQLQVNPTVTTDYSITVADDEGLIGTASTRLTVQDDTVVDDFFFSPASFTEQETGAIVTSTPLFGFGQASVTGLSPGVTVTATVSGTGARFSDGTTSKQIQNGTSTSLLAVSLTNSSTRNEQRTATLTIGSKSASFTSKTKACSPVNGTASIDNSITILTRQTNNASVFLGYGIEGGFGAVTRTVAAGGEQIFTSNGTFTPPAGITQVTIEGIAGGGGGTSGKACTGSTALGAGGGGGAAGRTTATITSGSFSVTIGSGGAGGLEGTTTTTTTSSPQTYTGSVSDGSSCSSISSGVLTWAKQNCGTPSTPTNCASTTSTRYYEAQVPSGFSGGSISISLPATKRTANDGGIDNGIFCLKSEVSTTGRIRVWFCRSQSNVDNKGTTFVQNWSWSLSGTQTGSTPVTTPGTPALPGGTTSVTYNGQTLLSLTGGASGRWVGGTRSPGLGGGNGGSASTSGGGGGAGNFSGGSNSAGGANQGGTGTTFTGTSTGSGSSGSGCSVAGGSGGTYGAGGGAATGTNSAGGSGAPGSVRFSWVAPVAQSATYSELVTEIFRAFWNKGNRGPTVSEIQTWVNNFKNDTITYPTVASISNAITVSNLSITIPPVDNCGDPIPRFP